MTTKRELIKDLIKDGYLKTSAIIEAFQKVDRVDFVPEALYGEAYGNYPLPIGFGQTISQPLTVAFMLELLQPKPGEKILDIGAGSGWQTALLGYVVSGVPPLLSLPAGQAGLRRTSKGHESRSEKGKIVGIERIPELKKMAEENVSKYNFIKKGIVEILLGDGSVGAPEEFLPPGGFDKIIAAAAIELPRESALRDAIPQIWKDQLKTHGRIVAPVGQSILTVDKISESKFETKEYFGFNFVPLVKGVEH